MTIKDLFKRLQGDIDFMEFNEPISQKDISKFESLNGVSIPPSLRSIFLLFNGGEIYVPGTIIYGLNLSDKEEAGTIKYENRKQKRSLFNIPQNYLIFGKLNYGDVLCINLNSPFDVLLWDHELDEESCSWSSLEEWLEETIVSFHEYEDGQL